MRSRMWYWTRPLPRRTRPGRLSRRAMRRGSWANMGAARLPPFTREGRSALQELEQGFLVRHADVLALHLATLEDHHGRHALDAEALGDARALVDVDLRDLVLADVLVGDLVDDRRELLARAAPRGREVDQDGGVGLEHLAVEGRVGNGDDVLAAGHAKCLPLGFGNLPFP